MANATVALYLQFAEALENFSDDFVQFPRLSRKQESHNKPRRCFLFGKVKS